MYEKIEKGEFAEIKAWLTDKVHKHGKSYSSLNNLLEAQLGEKLNAKYFIQYLTTKYSELYKCEV
jgi:carboxypeptidase Taq